MTATGAAASAGVWWPGTSRGVRGRAEVVAGWLCVVLLGGFWGGLAYGAYLLDVRFMLVPLALLAGCYFCFVGGIAMVAARHGLARVIRVRAGAPDALDVVRYVRERWGSDGQWALAVFPYEDMCEVRAAVVGDVRFGRQRPPTHSPMVVYRWLQTECPVLLACALRAGFDDAGLVAYMDGDAAERESMVFLLALSGLGSREAA